MKLKIKRIFIQSLIYILKGSLLFKRAVFFAFGFLKKPLSPFGRFIYRELFNLYKIYFFAKRLFIKIFPAKSLLSVTTNKYFIHAAIVAIALGTVTQNLYARTESLGDFGKNSILFKLTKPVDEQEELVAGLPINSDIEPDLINGQSAGANIDISDSEPFNVLGFVGGEQILSINTASTRTNIEYYVVQKGDTLGSIAAAFGLNLNTLLWANNLTSRSYIRPGDRLTILPLDGVSYAVKKGDTVQGIAKKYNVDAEQIKEFNHLADIGALAVGQVVIVPGGKVIYTPPPPSAYASGYTVSKTYASSGALLWPVAASHRITQYYSWRHPAIDVGLPTGSAVVASEAGAIIYAGWGTGYGYEVLIDHGNGLKTRYAHNSRLLVRKGDNVGRGQTIAWSGNTGWSTGPHLHFEVYSGSIRQNPLLYIK